MTPTTPSGNTPETHRIDDTEVLRAFEAALRFEQNRNRPIERHPLSIAALRLATGSKVDAILAHRSGTEAYECGVHTPVMGASKNHNGKSLLVTIHADRAANIELRCRSTQCNSMPPQRGCHRPHHVYTLLQYCSHLAGTGYDYSHFAEHICGIVAQLESGELAAPPGLALPAFDTDEEYAAAQMSAAAARAKAGLSKRTDYPPRTAAAIDAECRDAGLRPQPHPDQFLKDPSDNNREYRLVDFAEHFDHHGDGDGYRYGQARYEAETMDGRRLKTFRHYAKGADGLYTKRGGQPAFLDEARPLLGIREAAANPTRPAVVVSGALNAKSVRREFQRRGIDFTILSHSYGDNFITDFTPLEKHEARVIFMPDAGHDTSRKYFTAAAETLAAAGVSVAVTADHPELPNGADAIDLLAGCDASIKAGLKAAACSYPDTLKAEPLDADPSRVQALADHIAAAVVLEVAADAPIFTDDAGNTHQLPRILPAATGGQDAKPTEAVLPVPRAELPARVQGAPDAGGLERVAQPVALDTASEKMVLFIPGTATEKRVPKHHKTGNKSLADIAPLDEWKAAMDWKPTYTNKKGEEVQKRPPSLGGEFGDSILDRYHAAIKKAGDRYRITADLRAGVGAATVDIGGGEKLAIYNLGNALVVKGKRVPMTAELLLQVAASDDLHLSHIYTGKPSAAELEKMRRHLAQLIRELSVLGFRTEGGARAWLAWWCSSILSGCVGWRPHYVIKSDGGQGKGTLIDLIARPLFGELLRTSHDLSHDSIYGEIGSNSLPFFMDEANALDESEQKAINSLQRRASEDGIRSRLTRESDYKKLRRTRIRSPLYRSLNDLADPKNIPTRRRIYYEILAGEDIPNFAQNRKLITMEVAGIGDILARQLIANVDVYRREVQRLRDRYAERFDQVKGCQSLNSKQIDSAAGMAVAEALAFGFKGDEVYKSASLFGGSFKAQLEAVESQWSRRLVDILTGGIALPDGGRCPVAELVAVVTSGGTITVGGNGRLLSPATARQTLGGSGFKVGRKAELRIDAGGAAFRQFCRSNGIANPNGAEGDLLQHSGNRRVRRRAGSGNANLVEVPAEVYSGIINAVPELRRSREAASTERPKVQMVNRSDEADGGTDTADGLYTEQKAEAARREAQAKKEGKR